MEEEPEIMSLKILIVGEPTVGKTSISKRYSKGIFTSQYKSTIGVDFLTKHLKWNDKLELHLQLWDLAGQDKIGLQVRTYFKGTLGAICIYDVKNDLSKAKTLDWKDMLTENCLRHDNTQSFPPILLIGNKVDLLEEDKIPSDAEINREAINMGFIGGVLTSAKNNIGIDGAMATLITEILQRQENPLRYIIKGEQQEQGIVKLTPSEDSIIEPIRKIETEKGCCY
jgi:small GTP-binding protein